VAKRRANDVDRLATRLLGRPARRRGLPPGNPPSGRNDPCLCGSGKTFKRCCLVGPLSGS
jgi:uncharacterized protein YecA (UPF0149 family)